MASEALEKAGLHFDDLNRIRVLDEDTSSQVGIIDCVDQHSLVCDWLHHLTGSLQYLLRLRSLRRFVRIFWVT